MKETSKPDNLAMAMLLILVALGVLTAWRDTIRGERLGLFGAGISERLRPGETFEQISPANIAGHIEAARKGGYLAQ